MLQRPWDSPEVALAIQGHAWPGLMCIAGAHGLIVVSPSQFGARFNARLCDAGFLFSHEACWPGRKEAEGALECNL